MKQCFCLYRTKIFYVKFIIICPFIINIKQLLKVFLFLKNNFEVIDL